jgi:hypothetical protein
VLFAVGAAGGVAVQVDHFAGQRHGLVGSGGGEGEQHEKDEEENRSDGFRHGPNIRSFTDLRPLEVR